ncbi:MAG TPA: hypothetical protein VKZ84_01170 [Bacteriovoracaceae bacterium]|nr:hypothetical protein [Bacteriovoracaceae bacterium]
MKILLGCMLLASSFAFADSHDEAHKPKSFVSSGRKIVFVNYKEVTYNITYDINRGRAHAVATMRFNATEQGFPVFDSLAKPTSVTLNGKAVRHSEVKTPSRETEVRIPNQEVPVGDHLMTVEVPLSYANYGGGGVPANFGGGAVRSAFWNSDINNRGLLERYLPTNFEFDRIKMKFIVNIVGAKVPHSIFTNGVQKEIAPNVYEIDFPKYFTSSSIYFHVTPTNAMKVLNFNIDSKFGNKIPTTIYTLNNANSDQELAAFKAQTIKIINELENDYGKYPHPNLVIYAQSPNGGGGMEYAGAAVTSLSALGHELIHSYFGRGVMPANGNAGWIDEAIATWRDRGYPNFTELNFQTRMGNMAYYTRWTDVNAYDYGSRFIGYLNHKLGDIKPFLADLVANDKFKPLFTEEFVSRMEAFYGKSFKEEFKHFVQNDRDIIPRSRRGILKEQYVPVHPIHKPLSDQELFNLL